MSRRVASCPACGAELEFRGAGTLWVACPFCGGASTRSDLRLDLLGRVATVASIPSPFALGERRTLDGRSVTFLGQRQLDHGSGPWNEWYVAGDDGRGAWIAEARGLLLLFRETSVGAEVPSWFALKPGMTIPLGPGEYTVEEKGRARVVAAAGEFPRPERVGEEFRYVDLRGPGKAVATLDYGGDAPLAFQGKICDPEDLGLTVADFARSAPARTGAERLACPKCGGQVDLRDPASPRVGCRSCGSLLDTTEGALRVLHAFSGLASRPFLPLGSAGRVRGRRYEVRAMLERSVRVDGIRYPWQEYLLVDETGGQRWLTRADNHWSFVEPVGPGDVKVTSKIATLRGKRYRHFQGGTAKLDFVLGELPWEARIGDESTVADYVRPPETLSVEDAPGERIVTLCSYMPPEELKESFALERMPPTPRGVAPNQPNRWEETRRFAFRCVALFALLVLVLTIVLHMRARNREVFRGTYVADRAVVGGEAPPAGTAEDEARGRVVLSEEFVLSEPTNLRVELDAAVSNDWLGLDGALVNLESGEVRAFPLLAEYYFGTEGGERWSEGSRSARTHLGPLEPGRYALRFEPAVAPGTGFIEYHVRAVESVASAWRPWILLIVLTVPALLTAAAYGLVESARWQNSDHAT